VPSQTLAFWSASTLYALASIAALAGFAFRKPFWTLLGTWGAVIALIPHATAIVLRWQEVDHGPYSSRYEVLSANAFLLVIALLLVARFLRGLEGLGALILPVVFLMMGFAVTAFDLKYEVPIIFKSYWLFLHILFAKVYGVAVLLAAATAAAFLFKARDGQRLTRLPSAERLDLYAHQFLLLAFLFLGVMIVAGSIWAHESWGRYWAWDPIETSSLVTWLAMGVILHFRVLHHWSGRRMAYLCFVALALSIGTVYIVTLAVPTIHDFYLVGR
jgi:ABC-type transport system involved in cytochrome c biogenesis permease subunit